VYENKAPPNLHQLMSESLKQSFKKIDEKLNFQVTEVMVKKEIPNQVTEVDHET
jgi:hypothetical protein